MLTNLSRAAMRLDFPAPVRPTTATLSPAATPQLVPANAYVPPAASKAQSPTWKISRWGQLRPKIACFLHAPAGSPSIDVPRLLAVYLLPHLSAARVTKYKPCLCLQARKRQNTDTSKQKLASLPPHTSRTRTSTRTSSIVHIHILKLKGQSGINFRRTFMAHILYSILDAYLLNSVHTLPATRGPAWQQL
eukprot:1158844-Pelagomonas_calceolata.AAC.1